jgi:hypothetical protein
VIVCDSRGFAGLITSRNFESLRAMNFGLRCLAEPITVDRYVQEIGHYDPDDASRVAERARADADLSKLLDKFEKLYDEVLTGERRPSVTAEARERAVARFLHENLPRRPGDARWPWLAERENLQREVETSKHTADALTGRLDELQRQLAVIARERDEARYDLDNAHSQLAELKRSRLLKVGRLLRRIAGLPVPY